MLRTEDSHLAPFHAETTSFNEHRSRLPPPSYRTSVHDQSSLDIPGRIEQKLAQYNASQSIYKRWLFEIVSVTISAVCMGAIIGLLHYLHDQSLSKWPMGLTIITVLSKIASAALILPISEAIGQLKWTWFHGKKSKDVFDFEIFDKASRGAWGSVMLLFRTKGKSLAALGALLTVLLLAIDTFFQQVTDFPERWQPRGDSFIPRIVRYEPTVENAYDNLSDIPIAQVNGELSRAIKPFFYDKNGTQPITTGNATQVEIPLVCPTGRCEWPPYETLSVCSACEDVSDLLEYACLPMKMDWIRNSTGQSTESTYPNGTACGFFLNATSEDPVLMSGYRVENGTPSLHGETLLMRTLPLITNPLRKPFYGDGSIKFKHIQYPILDTLIVSSADGSVNSVYDKKPPVAQECVLSWCVKTLRSSYVSGGYEEQVLETFQNTTSADWPWWSRDRPELRMFELEFNANITIRPPSMTNSRTTFGVSNETFMDVVTIMDEVFPSFITVSNASAPPFIKIRTSFRDKVVFRPVRFSPWLAPNNVTRHLERMAQAVTNVIRSDANDYELIKGTAYIRETYVAVHWAWLTFPLAMLLLSIVFLAATILKTSSNTHDEIGIWKTSALPSLVYGLPKEMQKDLISTAAPANPAGRGLKQVRIRLSPQQGWRVSGHVQAGPAAPPGFI